MVTADWLRLLFADLESADHAGTLTAMVEERRPLLLGTPGVAAALTSDGEMDEERRLAVFSLVLDAARLDMENRGRLGKRFLAEAADAIAALSEAGSLDPEIRASLLQAYASAGVEAPEILVPAVQASAPAKVGPEGLPDHLHQQIEGFRREFGGDDYTLHTFLNELLGGMPVPLQAAFVQHVARRDEEWCGSLALYWLLSPVPKVRLAAVRGLEERARQDRLNITVASTLTLIRTWVPAGEVLPVLDAVVREAHTHKQAKPLKMPELHPSRLLGSLPDGSGSQSFAISLEGADGPAAAFMLLKAGHGVKDAYLVRDRETADAILSELARMSEVCSIDRASDALEPALSAALAEGLAEGKAAPAGLIDVARTCGFGTLRPQAMTVRDWVSRIDPGGEVARLPAAQRAELVERSRAWPLDHNLVKEWFEGTAIVDEAREGVSDSRQLNAALWAALRKRRGYWALLMVRAAHVLQVAADDRDWRSFVATAMALTDGEALEGIPIMQHVLDTSVAAWQEEERALDAGWPSAGGMPCHA